MVEPAGLEPLVLFNYPFTLNTCNEQNEMTHANCLAQRPELGKGSVPSLDFKYLSSPHLPPPHAHDFSVRVKVDSTLLS